MKEFLNSFEKLEFNKVKNYIKRYAISELARERLEKLTPSSDASEIQYRLSLLSEMKKLLEIDDPLPIYGFTDTRNILSKAAIQDSILQSNELLLIFNVLKVVRNISQYFSRRKNTYPFLNQLINQLYVNKILEYNIDKIIDENGLIRDDASSELRKIRREINDKSESLRRKMENILKNVASLGWTQEDIITTRDGRMVIPIKIENKNKIPGFVHSISSSGATVFIEPAETLEMNNEIRSLQFQEVREIERILKEITTQIRENINELRSNIEILGELDYLQAAANYSIEILGNAPEINSENYFNIINGRHPILLMKHRRDEVVPLNITLGKDIKSIVITGPNAGGKSVAIKTFGLLVIMVQSGLHIPVSPDSTMGIYEKLFVDIGDEQSIEADLSTFSSHLENLKTMLQYSDEKSLVIIDEIGAGTDPIEGSAIAQALLLELNRRSTHCLVTTHHGTLKAFAHETAGIENAAMEFDHNTLKPTYRLIIGIPGSSYAIEMAKRIGLSEQFIAIANQYRSTNQQTLENLLANLEQKNQALVKEISEVQNERRKLETLIIDYNQKIKKLEKELKEIKVNALQEAKEIVSKANSLIEKTIKEIRESNANRGVIKQSQQNIKATSEHFTDTLKSLEVPTEDKETDICFNVGDIVRLKSSNEVGEIIEILKENNFNVLFGNYKIKVNKSNLLKAEFNEKKNYQQKIKYEFAADEIKNEIDIRGLMGDEAIPLLDKFIDKAILKGYNRIDIIHGKGTGALQKKVSQYLKSHPLVKNFRLGEWNEGGYGVTVVELK
ncbi:MAG: Recombination inhibitory protein MutS2 [Ignavibacteriae bacterium]|nr:MAG: Recombination inhibitory protein MutS2 [Ignavibacteriota bacterium]